MKIVRLCDKKKILAAVMAAVMAATMIPVGPLPDFYASVAYGYAEKAAAVKATSLNIRSGPGTNYSAVAKLSYGTAVTVVGESTDSSGALWYQIRFSSGQNTADGYVSSAYIKFPVAYTADADFENYLNQQGFPDSYKDSLRALHAEYPSWVFQAEHTGLDWNDVIANEGKVGANLVDKGSISSWKSIEYGAYDWNTGKWPGFDGATWVAASKEIICHYMDPRNFINEKYIFQFLLHSYDGSIHTREGLQSLVKGTFLEKTGDLSGSGSGDPNGASGPGGGSGSGGQASAGGQEYGPGYTGGAGLSAGETQAPAGSGENQQSSAPAGSGENQQPASGAGGFGNVSLEGPAATVSERKTFVAMAANTEYGPGMDASVITGDETGASSTSPIPSGTTYVDIIMSAAQQSGVNPYVIGAMIIQEQGKGTSGSISGRTPGYEGYYNFFNIGAYADGSMSAVTRGLWYASQSGSYGRPWNSIEKSIFGGSRYYGDNYVKAGQDTFYLKKFNVQGGNLYKHQYMTNIEGAAGEGAKLSNAYTADMKKQTLVFKIPVYQNMPQTACARPTVSGSPNNKLSSLTVSGYVLTPTFGMDTESYDIIVNPSVSAVEVGASPIDSKAAVTVTGAGSLQSGANVITVEVKAENGSVRTYRLNVVRRSDAPVVNAPSSGGSSAPDAGAAGPGMTGGPGSGEDGEKTAQTSPAPGGTSGGQTGVQVGVAPDGSGTDQQTQPVGQEEKTGGPGQAAGETAGQTAAAPTQASNAPEEPLASPGQTEAASGTEAPGRETAQDAPQPSASGGSPGSGDVNGDKNVTVLDLMMIKRHILGETILSGSSMSAADMNGDGKVDKTDAIALEKRILGK